jgi:hypothetical protein
MVLRLRPILAAMIIAIVHFFAMCFMLYIHQKSESRICGWLSEIFAFPLKQILHSILHFNSEFEINPNILAILVIGQSCCWGILLSFIFFRKKKYDQ